MKINKLATLIALFFACISYAQQDTVYLKPNAIPADLNSIVPPAGFTVAEKFNGYFDANSSTSITLMLIENINYTVMQKSMTDDFAQTNKLTKIAEGPVNSASGLVGVWYKYSFEVNAQMPSDTAQNMRFIRYMAFVGNLKQTLWINVTYPTMIDALMDAEILNCFTTANFTAKP